MSTVERPPEASFELGGRACHIVQVDDIVPQHRPGRDGPRTRLVYLEHELGHFDLGGHRYALMAEPVEAAACDASDTEHPRALLTNRELQIVQLICMGLLTKQVADRLHISEFTVRSYLKTVYCKLGVRSRGAMVFRYAQTFRADIGPGPG